MQIRSLAVSLSLLAITVAPAFAQQQKSYPFRDTSLSREKRIDNILSLMTTEEKIDCLSTDTALPRLMVGNSSADIKLDATIQVP